MLPGFTLLTLNLPSNLQDSYSIYDQLANKFISYITLAKRDLTHLSYKSADPHITHKLEISTIKK